MSVNRYDDALSEFEQNRFILAGDDECIDNFFLELSPK